MEFARATAYSHSPIVVTAAELRAAERAMPRYGEIYMRAQIRIAELLVEREEAAQLEAMLECWRERARAEAGIYWLRWFMVEATIAQLLQMHDRGVYIGPPERGARAGWGWDEEQVEALVERWRRK